MDNWIYCEACGFKHEPDRSSHDCDAVMDAVDNLMLRYEPLSHAIGVAEKMAAERTRGCPAVYWDAVLAELYKRRAELGPNYS